ncbi:MAG: MBL fold metallo-hydrolase, partial [Phycisphaerae bacterium]
GLATEHQRVQVLAALRETNAPIRATQRDQANAELSSISDQLRYSSGMKVGNWNISSIVNGTIRLDGGAMFGVVPRVLWAPKCDVDDHNRILLATRTLLITNESQGRVMLVDTGCGPKWSDDQADRYGIKRESEALTAALRNIGADEASVTDVIVSHLHFDHNGGLTTWRDKEGGELDLIYPNATHWIHKTHWDHAQAPHTKDRASFLAEDFRLLHDKGSLRLLEGEQAAPTGDAFGWFASGGHTPAQLHPMIEGDGMSVTFSGDIVPTARHLRPAWVMAYDVQPMKTIDEKLKLYQNIIERKTVLAFPHDPDHAAVTLTGEPKKPEIAEAIEL